MPSSILLPAAMDENYGDFIFNYSASTSYLEYLQQSYSTNVVNDTYAIIYAPLAQALQMPLNSASYGSFPNYYVPMDTQSMNISGITRLHNQPYIPLKGTGTAVAIIDSGIDYTNEVFRNSDGSSRIAYLWDQTIVSENTPPNLNYGTEYSKTDIDRALQAENPFDIVPSQDTLGHGTFTAGIAAGSENIQEQFIGAAPDATLIVVKLKPAKKYIHDYYLLPEDALVYQEDDIMTALSYVKYCTQRLGNIPLSICIPLGSNLGAHLGSSPLANYADSLNRQSQVAVSVAGGNEGNAGHHFTATIEPSVGSTEVELKVGEQQLGFTLELWGNSPTTQEVTLQSPSGETQPLFLVPPYSNQTLRFVFVNTIVYVNFILIENQSGGQLIMLRFRNPAPGIWKFIIQNQTPHMVSFHMWLPVTPLTSEDTYFLRSSPYNTITSPGNAQNVITTVAYNHRDDSIYLNSSRGFSPDNTIVPTLAAPGVDIKGPLPGGRFTTRSGTSIAAAHVCGAAALFLEWAIKNDNIPFLNGTGVKNYLIRGSRRPRNIEYPSPEWGYGILDLYNVFQTLT
ncbi:MAG: S8 family peptidase [Lachnospiraceae bacterium]|nr:S8 family peptidase [Lachnospiraceae bacterium]